MTIFALILLAFAMSTDAFATAIGKGIKVKKARLFNAIKLGLTFGVIEAITPLIGWMIGKSAASYVEAWDHWIALIILTGLGIHMIHQSLLPEEDDEDEVSPKPQSFFLVILTAIGTSIDAMAAGVSLAFVNVNIVVAASLIGAATFTMVTIGVMLGSKLGALIGKRAETFGGVILIGVGISIFYSHVF